MTSGLVLLLIVVATALAGVALSWMNQGTGNLYQLLKSSLNAALGKLRPKSANRINSSADHRSQHPESITEHTPARSPVEALIESVNEKLPQTQCAQCGHPGCRPYAQAIVLDDAPINQCPPGGQTLIDELAEFLGKQAIPLDAERGENKPAQIAFIDEAVCIGCTLCIDACPVDAIVGASRLMHTVIADQCTGCELCLPPCPVDCIDLELAAVPLSQWHWPKPGQGLET